MHRERIYARLDNWSRFLEKPTVFKVTEDPPAARFCSSLHDAALLCAERFLDCVPSTPETTAYVSRILALLGGAGAIVAPAFEVRLAA
jgi:hypothetical protein